MDGVSGLNQRPIEPGETFVYEFTVRDPGTYMYHSHYDEMTQIALGMHGMFIVHPKRPVGPRVDFDFALMTHEWRIEPGAARPDASAMNDFNVLTFNSKAYPGTEPLVVTRGSRVRVRLGNLSPMDHHPIHLHGLNFKLTATDGGYIPSSAQRPDTTVLVPVGSTRVIEFVPSESGDWAMHCHMTHHVMNQMGHGIPNMIGVSPGKIDRRVRPLLPRYMTMGQDGMGEHGKHIESGHMGRPKNSLPMVGQNGPHDYITMGGMFTLFKVREGIQSYEDPGWYDNPPGTMADLATPEELARDGVKT